MLFVCSLTLIVCDILVGWHGQGGGGGGTQISFYLFSGVCVWVGGGGSGGGGGGGGSGSLILSSARICFSLTKCFFLRMTTNKL